MADYTINSITCIVCKKTKTKRMNGVCLACEAKGLKPRRRVRTAK